MLLVSVPHRARMRFRDRGLSQVRHLLTAGPVNHSLERSVHRDLDEACEYLRDPILRARYEEITTAVAEKLEAGVPVERLMGGPTDLKLASSLTLFHAAAWQLGNEASDALVRRCDAILRITAPQGYRECSLTAKQLSSPGR